MRIQELEFDFDQIFLELEARSGSEPLSLTILSPLLLSRAQSKGLEEQKRWISNALFVESSTFSNVLFYFKGIAAEGGRDPLEILETLHNQLFRHIEGDGLALAIYASVLPTTISLEAFRVIMGYISGESVVDQYEMAVNAVTSNLLIGAGSSREEIQPLLSVMESAEDWRAAAVQAVLDGRLPEKICVPITCQASEDMHLEIGASEPAKVTDREYRTKLANYFLTSPSTPNAYLALSHYTARYAQTTEEYLRGLSKREVARQYFENKSGFFAPRSHIALDFESVSARLKDESNKIERNELFKLAGLLGISERKPLELLSLLYDETREDEAAASYFPTDQFSEFITDDEISTIAGDPMVASALAPVSDSMGEDGISLQFLAVEEYLEAQGARKPSELKIEDEDVESFLYNACTIECIKQSLEFVSSSEVEEERLKILQKLKEFSPSRQKKYDLDIHKIVGQQTVNELLKRYEVGKIHCDEREIKIWARDTLTARYIRLRDYISAGMLPVEPQSDIEFVSHISEGRAGSFVFRVPNSDAYNLARSIVEELLQKYSLDPRHGIDSYLSLGMRHGALIDHLRSPISRNKLITSKTLTGYEASEYWKHTFALSGDSELGEMVSDALIVFSQRYDEKLNALKDDFIQVRRAEKPDGIIDLDWSEGEILAFIATFIRLDGLDETLEEFSGYYWQLAELRLAPSRHFILNEVKSDLFHLFTELEEGLSRASGYQRLGPFTDQVMRAKEELSTALKELASWHNVAKSTDVEPISLSDIISASEKIARRLHPTFNPVVRISGDKDVRLSSSLNILIEVFKALYINVCVHSSVLRPNVNIEVSSEDPNALTVVFKSSCSDVLAAQAAAEVAQEKIMSGEYEDKLSTEGGSGLPKVARATVRDGKPQTKVWVDEENRMFCVEMSFVLINLRGD